MPATFIIAIVVGIGGLAAGFDQAKANPDADNFFQSTSHVAKDGSSAD